MILIKFQASHVYGFAKDFQDYFRKGIFLYFELFLPKSVFVLKKKSKCSPIKKFKTCFQRQKFGCPVLGGTCFSGKFYKYSYLNEDKIVYFGIPNMAYFKKKNSLLRERPVFIFVGAKINFRKLKTQNTTYRRMPFSQIYSRISFPNPNNQERIANFKNHCSTF